jgi:DNA-binding MarR family transcriptional regulator
MTTNGTLGFDPIAEARRQWEDHGWGTAAAGMEVVTSVMRIQQLLLAAVDESLEPFGLTFARFELLALLSFTREGALPLGKIGARLQVHPASVTNVVDRLEAEGFVRRQAHPTDRRAILATLTPEGRVVAAKATDALNEQVFAALELPVGDLETVNVGLRALRVAAGDPDASGATLGPPAGAAPRARRPR